MWRDSASPDPLPPSTLKIADFRFQIQISGAGGPLWRQTISGAKIGNYGDPATGRTAFLTLAFPDPRFSSVGCSLCCASVLRIGVFLLAFPTFVVILVFYFSPILAGTRKKVALYGPIPVLVPAGCAMR